MSTGKRVVTFGRQPTTPPPGNFREIHFPELARLEQGTNEGMISRILHSEGANARSLPRTIYFQKSQEPGHFGAVATGSLHEMTVDGETGLVSGKGWVLDSPEGHDMALHVIGQALFHNSIDMAEVKVRFEEHGDFWDDDFHVDIHFDEWSLAATTLVGKPAFADAHAVMMEELKASLHDTSPLVVSGIPIQYRILTHDRDEEIAARATGVPRWADFHRPESETPHKLMFGEPVDGFIPVYGHLGLWESCHDGIEARCVRIPRPIDNYASFNKPGVLTDRGEVECGPIVLYGGHVSLDKAADDPANAWADVRVSAGVHGPWLSGVVRPGRDPVELYDARASRLSGHWKGGRLKMIVSCNAEGFDVPGSGFSFSTNGAGEVDELVASFPGCGRKLPPPPPPAALLSMQPLSEADQRKALEWAFTNGSTYSITTGTATTTESEAVVARPESDLSIQIEHRRRLLALDDD
jgi:hypothetical protein